MKWFKKAQYVILYLLGFGLIGITSLITGEIGFAGWRDARFYVDTILTYMAIICIIIATVLKIVDQFKETNQEYKDSNTKIQTFAEKSYIPSLFTKYADHANEKRKLKQYLFNIKKKIYNLEKSASEEDLHTWVNGTSELKANNTFCKKRAFLEQQLTDNYIKKYLPTMFVEYDRITATVILGGYYSAHDADSANEFVTKNQGRKMLLDNLPRLLYGFAFTAFTSSLILDIAFSTNALISILTKTLVLCYQTFLTIRYANNWNEEVTLKDIRFRKGIINEYETWLKQQYAKQQESQENQKRDNKSILHDLEKTELKADLDSLKSQGQAIEEIINTGNIEGGNTNDQ